MYIYNARLYTVIKLVNNIIVQKLENKRSVRIIPIDEKLAAALELCGFMTGDRQESRLMSILGVILRLQEFPPIPLTFAEIYEQFQREDPSTKLTKAWVHRVLKSLVDIQLIRVENPKAHRKRYIADVNTIVTGFELLKSSKVADLETRGRGIDEELAKVNTLDCGYLSKELVKEFTGSEKEVSSRIVRGVDELDRVLRYNMLDLAGKGDVVRATVLWAGPFVDEDMKDRTMKFVEAAERGADIRYLFSTDIFRVEKEKGISVNVEEVIGILMLLAELKKSDKKFDARLYAGPKTYNQISLNRESMALIITENPITATWITRKFNPDLIDNAVKTFDKDWKTAKSVFDLTQEEFEALGGYHEGLIHKIIISNIKRRGQ